MTRLIFIGTVHRDPAGKGRLLRLLEEIHPAAISLEVSPASVHVRREAGLAWLRVFRLRLQEVIRRTGRSARHLMTGSGLGGVYEYLRLPYEYRAALTYARVHSCPVFLLDDSDLATNFLMRVESEILTLKNLILLAEHKHSESLRTEVAGQYSRAERLLFPDRTQTSNPTTLFGPSDIWQNREESLAKKLRLLHQGLVRRAGQTVSGQVVAGGLLIPGDAIGYLPEQVVFPEHLVHVYISGWEHLLDRPDARTLYSLSKDLGPEIRLCIQPEAEGR